MKSEIATLLRLHVRRPLHYVALLEHGPRRGLVTIITGNKELRLETDVPGSIQKPSAVALRPLLEVLEAELLPGVGLTLVQKGGALIWGNLQLRLLSEKETPPILRRPEWSEIRKIVELESDIAGPLRQAARDASDDWSRPVLAGVCFDWRQWRFCGADGFRMRLRGPLRFPQEYIIIPRAAVPFVPAGVERIEIGTPFITFHSPRRRLTSALIAGEYPHYDAMLKDGHMLNPTWSFQTSAPELKAALQARQSIAKNAGGIVRLYANGNGILELYLKGEDALYSQVLPASVDGPVMIAVNHGYLLSAVSDIAGDVEVYGSKASSPIVVCDPGDPDAGEVIMPMYTDWSPGWQEGWEKVRK